MTSRLAATRLAGSPGPRLGTGWDAASGLGTPNAAAWPTHSPTRLHNVRGGVGSKIRTNYTGSLPLYGAASYCVNASIQFYTPQLTSDRAQHPDQPEHVRPTAQLPAYRQRQRRGTFIGDYFGNTTGPVGTGTLDYSTFASTYDDGTNPAHYQQQIVATVSVP
jgi:hypothetical protein